MKRILMGIALVPCMAFATLDEGLVAWYKFDGDIKDSSGQGNDLSALHSVSYCANHRGIDQSAVQMVTNRLACIGNIIPAGDYYGSKYILTNAWTFACWFKTDNGTALQTESTYDIWGADDEIQYLYFPGGGSTIAVGTNGVNVFEHHSDYMPATLRHDADLVGWHHLAVTIDSKASGFKLYLDGKFIKQGLQTGRDKNIDVLGGLKVDMSDGNGLGGGYYGSSFDGALDNVYVYNRPLSAEEVKALYDGYSWSYDINEGEASVTGVKSTDPATPISGAITIPSVLGGSPVTRIDSLNCENITAVTIPASVTTIGESAFEGCDKLSDVYFEGETLSSIGADAFHGCNWDLIMHVPADWQGRGRTLCGYSVWRAGSSDEEKSVSLTTTNIVVQYVLNSVQPEIAVPVSGDTGFVSVITEVTSSGAVSVPIEWKANYPQYEAKFGTDFGKSLMAKSGKRDCANNEMLVWQDYVAGTDPTDENSKFTASITMVEGVPVISHSPELTAEQAALRTYKTFGKKQLGDTEWTNLTDASGETLKAYNFFKVTVEMK